MIVSRLGQQVMRSFSLQSPNILLTDTGVCKVADVGLGKMLASEVGIHPVCPFQDTITCILHDVLLPSALVSDTRSWHSEVGLPVLVVG